MKVRKFLIRTVMSLAKRFEDLRIWQEARVRAAALYRAFGIGTPAERDFGFRDQIQRAGVSMMNNIAEGFERRTPADFSRFLDYASGSTGEVCSMLYLAEDLDYMDSETANTMRESAEGLSKGIESFANSIRSRS